MGEKTVERIEKWDNLKGLLIFLVVIGHSYLTSLKQAESTRILYFAIYTFHIPLFIFISGVFSRRTVETGKGLKRKVAGYVLLGFLLKFAVVGVKLLLGGFQAFHMWSESGVPWYLFALAGYLLLTWVLRKVSRTTLLIIAVVFACFAGYDADVGDLLILSRFLVFYPFFLLGTCWDPTWTEPRQNALAWKAAAACLLIGFMVFVAMNIEWLYGYINLVKGGTSFILMKKGIGKEMVNWGAMLRMIHYAAAAAISAAIVILMPGRRTPLGSVGRRTLQIYFLHRPCQKILELTGFCAMLQDASPAHWHLWYLICNVILVLLLSLPFWEKPFRWFWGQLKEL